MVPPFKSKEMKAVPHNPELPITLTAQTMGENGDVGASCSLRNLSEGTGGDRLSGPPAEITRERDDGYGNGRRNVGNV
jgi:hypothetical protein